MACLGNSSNCREDLRRFTGHREAVLNSGREKCSATIATEMALLTLLEAFIGLGCELFTLLLWWD